jgi:hypothetical protein
MVVVRQIPKQVIVAMMTDTGVTIIPRINESPKAFKKLASPNNAT